MLGTLNSNERQNRTSTNMTRSMISTCHLAKSFQVEALQTVAYILSKVHSYSSHKTSFELGGKRESLSCFKIWGCVEVNL